MTHAKMWQAINDYWGVTTLANEKDLSILLRHGFESEAERDDILGIIQSHIGQARIYFKYLDWHIEIDIEITGVIQ